METQQVTVAAENTTTVSVEAENNATALVISGQDLQSLPDDPDDLSSALQALAGPGAGPGGGQMYIDGFSGGQLPPKETIREVRINQNPFSAEYDRLGFGRIEILTKPGTGNLHGMAFFNDSDATFRFPQSLRVQQARLFRIASTAATSAAPSTNELLSSSTTTSATSPTTPSLTPSFSTPIPCCPHRSTPPSSHRR